MSKLSEKLYERAKPLWDKESENEFVAAMAEGTLEEEKLCMIFEKCAHYETRFWNIFISVKP